MFLVESVRMQQRCHISTAQGLFWSRACIFWITTLDTTNREYPSGLQLQQRLMLVGRWDGVRSAGIFLCIYLLYILLSSNEREFSSTPSLSSRKTFYQQSNDCRSIRDTSVDMAPTWEDRLCRGQGIVHSVHSIRAVVCSHISTSPHSLLPARSPCRRELHYSLTRSRFCPDFNCSRQSGGVINKTEGSIGPFLEITVMATWTYTISRIIK
jgi:hypothetical protein